ncbi:hypothetical protein ZOSMA_35G00530 [Zostera marina]|uniref:TOD1/MUCI70 glycosyltransferase-like domain-containing protein n=1 Tax=Zostera marina TaxID=29655 RepID=A0A0K9P6H0_ZOSMR|nr:hypothetical protein ZOSMA_35G00530 [Zostera marina]
MFLFFVPALIVLVLESSRMEKKIPITVVNVKKDNKMNVEVVHGNLNRLDPTTRIVAGMRRRCLELMSPEEMQLLRFPPEKNTDSPLNKSLVFRSGSEESLMDANGTRLWSYSEGTRFNLFTGNQTLLERKESFNKMNSNSTSSVHCGFYNFNGGFRISDDDKIYMKTCQAVVSTCAFGGGDDIYQPIGMTAASLDKVCYVAFWDEITHLAQEAGDRRIDENHMIGKWRIVIVKDLPFVDQRLNGKIPKMLTHRLFPQSRYSIWVDSKSQFRRDPLGVFEALLWRTNSVFAISEHGARSSIYDEGKAIVKKNKASPEEVSIQLTQYKQEGFSDIKRFNEKKALSEASIIIREHTAETNLLMCVWFNEVVRFTSRDQLSFPYVLRQLKISGVNMFPVCTRKDMVNSMGHKKKVKPLVI